MRNKLILLVLLFALALNSNAQTPVAAHGHLSIDRNKMKDEHGNDYQLRGMSLFWSNWQGKFFNYDAIKWLRDDWHVNVVRAAMGISTDDNSGYLGHPDLEKQKIITVIEAAIDLGIYVIVDWHSHHAENETSEAQEFFAEIAQTYGSYPNIIYETYNEPITGWSEIKAYHEAVVGTIRTYDPDNVVILGTPFYSQNIDEATNNPLSGVNLCYALHYYAASHTFWNSVQQVSDKGYYVFVSEFGTCSSTGDGGIDVGSSNQWWDVLDQYGVGWCNWSVSDVDEAASIVYPGSSPTGNWSAADLTQNGNLVRNKLRSYATDPVPTDIAPYITSSPKTQSVPFESSTSFSVEVAGPGPMSYQWYFNGSPISGANSMSYNIQTVTEDETGEYYCTIQNSYGTTISKTVTLDVRYRSTFYDDPQGIPGIIQFEDYDEGGQNIGYYDASYGNSGGGYRNNDVDLEEIQGAPGQFAVGFTDNGEWLAYSVNVGWDGEYEIDVYHASQQASGIVSVELDDTPISPEIQLPSTGGWFSYNKTTITVNLTAGVHIFKFNIVNAGFNIDYMEFKSTTPPETAPIITAHPRNSIVPMGRAAYLYVSATGKAPLSYQWYFNGNEISGATESTYEIPLVEESDAGRYFVIVRNELGSDTSNVASLEVTSSSAYMGIPAVLPGRVLCKNFDEGGNGVAYFDNTSGNEGVINSGDENYYRDEDVDTEVCTDGESGHSIGYITADEWLEYSVMVQYTGTYTVDFRVASGSNGGIGALALNVDGLPAISTLSVPNTGGWAEWATINDTVYLTKGSHILRFKANQGDFNINYMDFSIELSTQTIELQSGWNLVSFNVSTTSTIIEDYFSSLEGIVIKSTDGFYNSRQLDYLNSIHTLNNDEGYLIFNPTNETVTISIQGTSVSYTPNFTNVASGWHLVPIGALDIPTSELPVNVLDVKNFNQFYSQGNNLSTLTTLLAGETYWVRFE